MYFFLSNFTGTVLGQTNGLKLEKLSNVKNKISLQFYFSKQRVFNILLYKKIYICVILLN